MKDGKLRSLDSISRALLAGDSGLRFSSLLASFAAPNASATLEECIPKKVECAGKLSWACACLESRAYIMGQGRVGQRESAGRATHSTYIAHSS